MRADTGRAEALAGDALSRYSPAVAMLDLPSGGAGAFPVAHCGPCERDVLTHVALDDDGESRRRCVHCDAEIDPHELRWVADVELDPLGYVVYDDDAGGCGRPGCGRGNCANRR